MMCSERVKVPGRASKVIFSLLLLSSACRGLRAVHVFHLQAAEVAVGQNVSLPCILNSTDPSVSLKIFQMQWSKGGDKLVVHLHGIGTHSFTSSFGFHAQTDDQNGLIGSVLHLYDVQVNDSGTYVCEFATYPLGSFNSKTRLKVQEAGEVNCDRSSRLEVFAGDNLKVQCEWPVYPRAKYSWYRNKTVVSEGRSLEVSGMDQSQAGVYTLVVSNGHTTRNRSFHITMLAPSESPTPDHTMGTPLPLTSQNTDLPGTEVHVSTASPVPTRQSTLSPPDTTTARQGALSMPPATGPGATTQGSEPGRGATNATAAATEEDRTTDEVTPRHSTATEEEETTTQGRLTGASADPASSHRTTAEQTMMPAPEPEGTGARLWWVALVVCAAAFVALGLLYWRRAHQRRADLPPPFKPPPPPRKYTSAKPRLVPAYSSIPGCA